MKINQKLSVDFHLPKASATKISLMYIEIIYHNRMYFTKRYIKLQSVKGMIFLILVDRDF